MTDDCDRPTCDYEEPHEHGFACGPDCDCAETSRFVTRQ